MRALATSGVAGGRPAPSLRATSRSDGSSAGTALHVLAGIEAGDDGVDDAGRGVDVSSGGWKWCSAVLLSVPPHFIPIDFASTDRGRRERVKQRATKPPGSYLLLTRIPTNALLTSSNDARQDSDARRGRSSIDLLEFLRLAASDSGLDAAKFHRARTRPRTGAGQRLQSGYEPPCVYRPRNH